MRRLTVVLTVLATVGSACLGGPPDEVRIGLVAALSGPHAAIGVDVERGARMAVEDLNRDGGLLGRPVELVVRDSAGGGDVPGILRDLAGRQHVTAVIGPDAPGPVLGERSPLAAADVPALLVTAFTGDLPSAPGVVLRSVPSARDQAEAAGRWLVEERAIDRVAVLVADPLEGGAAEEALTAGLADAGARTVQLLRADPAPDLTPAVTRLRDRVDDAGAVVVWGSPAVAARATNAIRAVGWDVQIVVPASAFVGEYRALTVDASEGVVLPFPFREDWFTGEVQDFFLRWHRRHRIEALADLDTLVLDLPVAGTAAYDAVGVVAAAVRSVDSRDPARVAGAITRTEHDGLLRTYRFDDREGWTTGDLHIARFHNLAVIYDADPRLDRERQRRFHDQQVRLEFLPDDLLEGAAGELVGDLIRRRRDTAPSYEPPAPPPQPVARPGDDDR